MAQAELRQPVPVAHPVKARVLAGTHQITGSLELRRGHVNRLEQPAGEQAREFARIPRIGLDAITGPLRHQPRRHYRAVDAALDQMAVEAEASRAGLVAAANRWPATQRALDRLLVVGQRPLL